MEYFISLFLRMSCHLKYFESANEITPKMYDFILEFHNMKFYFLSLVVYVMKRNLLIQMLVYCMISSPKKKAELCDLYAW
jgi:hypothetical protein